MSISMLLLRKIFPLFFTIIFSILFIGNSYGASFNSNKTKSKNPYIISNIFASAEEGSPSESKDLATIKANRIAFLVLLKNLGVDQTFAEKIDDAQIAKAIYSTQIVDESISGSYYSAKFNISFLKSTVGRFFDKIGVDEVVVDGEDSFLIIPVQVENGRQILWEANNSWRKALQESINFSNIRNIIIPKGDFSDLTSVNLRTIKNLSSSNFTSILRRYNANNIIIAYFEHDAFTNKVKVTFDKIDDDNKITKTNLSFINSKNLSKNGLTLEVAQAVVNHIVDSGKVEIKKIGSNDTPNNPGVFKMETMTDSIRKDNRLNEEINIFDLDGDKFDNRKIDFNVDISSLDDWLKSKVRIEAMDFVKSLKLESISKNSAKVTIEFSRKLKDPKASFAEYGFLLRSDKRGQYFLSPQ